jgi:hypothetical protein
MKANALRELLAGEPSCASLRRDPLIRFRAYGA